MSNFQINYTGSSKIIKRLCERVNGLPGLGSTHNDAFYGDLGQEAYDHSQITEGNPHHVTLEELGIGSLQNKIDAIYETIGSLDEWHDHTDAQMIDHDGDILIFGSLKNLLAWH